MYFFDMQVHFRQNLIKAWLSLPCPCILYNNCFKSGRAEASQTPTCLHPWTCNQISPMYDTVPIIAVLKIFVGAWAMKREYLALCNSISILYADCSNSDDHVLPWNSTTKILQLIPSRSIIQWLRRDVLSSFSHTLNSWSSTAVTWTYTLKVLFDVSGL